MRPFLTIALTLFLVIDALGNLPAYLSLVANFPANKRRLCALRELVIGLMIMFLFHFLGQRLLPLLGANHITVLIAGGTILFLIAIRLLFDQEQTSSKWHDSEPFIVPIATPIIAGPSVLSVIMIMAQENPSNVVMLGSITLAWFCSSIIFLLGKPIYKLMKEKGLSAAQRLMGLIVAIIAVQTFLRGVKGLLQS